MAEYTDLQCSSALVCALVLDYLHRELADEEDPPNITAYAQGNAKGGTLRITYHDLRRESELRREWDMQMLGFRDGVEHVSHNT